MSLLEGFSDWVMDEVGAQVLPDVRAIRDRFEARRSQRRGTLDRLIARLTGLDLKLEQYRRGERSCPASPRPAGRRDRGPVERAGGTAHARPRWPTRRPGSAASFPAHWRLRHSPPMARQDMASELDDAPGSGPGRRTRRRAGGDRPVARSCRRATSPSTSRGSRRRRPARRIVTVSLEGLADGDLSDVEVLLRGPLPQRIFDRLLGRCPRLMWVHSATAGVERVLTPLRSSAASPSPTRAACSATRSPSTC